MRTAPWSRSLRTLALACGVMLAVAGGTGISASNVRADDKPEVESAEKTPDQATLFKNFEETLSGAVLAGQFTVTGKEGPPRSEQYTIQSARKIPDQGDYWLITARIKYGDKDISVPMPLEVKWAGDTPVITLTNFTIPGLGTFSSRVVIHDGKYAGTWTHGEVGGHLFGMVQKKDAKPDPAKQPEKTDEDTKPDSPKKP
jgi:hypothetical protein